MSETRICKECGKPFVPKGRELYCSDIHYRPCPICGKPAEVKYFSDPPRKCDECRGNRSASGSAEKMQAPEEKKSFDNKFSKIPKMKSLFNFNPDNSTSKSEAKPVSKMVEPKMVEPKMVQSQSYLNKVEKEVPSTIGQAEFCSQMKGVVMMYIGKAFKNFFIPGHEYVINVDRDEYTYTVEGIEDVTAGEDCEIVIPYASQISFHQNFRKVKAEATS